MQIAFITLKEVIMKKCINLILSVLTTVSVSISAQADDAIVTDAYGRKILTAPTSNTLSDYIYEAKKHVGKNPDMVAANLERATNLAIQTKVPYRQLEAMIVASIGAPVDARSYSLSSLRDAAYKYKIRGFAVASAFAIVSGAASASESVDSDTTVQQTKDLGLLEEE